MISVRPDDLQAAVSAANLGVRASLTEWRDRRTWSRADPAFVARWPQVDAIPGWLTRVEAVVLYHFARFGPGLGDIVEIGSYQGRSTVCLASGALDRGEGIVHAVDPHTGDRGQLAQLGIDSLNTAPTFLRNLVQLDILRAVRPVCKPSVEAAALYAGDPIRLLFIDGWHSHEAVIEDFVSWQPFLAKAAVVIFDDFGTSPEVQSGILELRRLGRLPRHAFAFGKMIGFAPTRREPGGIPLHWVRR